MPSATEESLRAYRSAGVDAAIAAASPHQLVLLLFQGARAALAMAREAFARRDVPARGRAIAKAVAIIDGGLRSSLDVARGGALGEQLDALYEYIVVQLALANAVSDAARVDEADRLLAELEGGWREIGATPPSAAPGVPPSARREPLSYGKV